MTFECFFGNILNFTFTFAQKLLTRGRQQIFILPLHLNLQSPHPTFFLTSYNKRKPHESYKTIRSCLRKDLQTSERKQVNQVYISRSLLRRVHSTKNLQFDREKGQILPKTTSQKSIALTGTNPKDVKCWASRGSSSERGEHRPSIVQTGHLHGQLLSTSTVMFPIMARWCPSRVSIAIRMISCSGLPINCWQAEASISSFWPCILTWMKKQAVLASVMKGFFFGPEILVPVGVYTWTSPLQTLIFRNQSLASWVPLYKEDTSFPFHTRNGTVFWAVPEISMGEGGSQFSFFFFFF